MASSRRAVVSFAELQQHSTSWIVVNDVVYDISQFKHPGGMAILKPLLGSDASVAFAAHHNTDVLSVVRDKVVGNMDAKDEAWLRAKAASSKEQQGGGGGGLEERRRTLLPPLAHILNTHDLRSAAEKVMEPAGWAYYASAADDELTLQENEAAFKRIWFRPRVMVNVKQIQVATTLLGAPSSFPLYVTATALAKLADPRGEVAITRGAARQGVPYMCPTLGSCSIEEMCAARGANQTQWFQLYVNPDRNITREIIRRAEKGGCKALFVTVDAPQLGRRERDMRFKAPEVSSQHKDTDRSKGTSNSLSSFIDASLSWDDLPWLAAQTSMSICLKGIQCGEDAVLAARRGVKAIVVSNHGARQLDTTRSGVEMLVEVMGALRAEGLQNRVDVFVDGGIRRGTDIFKCIALGASGVGIGRPILHGLAAYGEDGVSKCIEMLREEFLTAMQLCGCATLSQIQSSLVSTSKL